MFRVWELVIQLLTGLLGLVFYPSGLDDVTDLKDYLL